MKVIVWIDHGQIKVINMEEAFDFTYLKLLVNELLSESFLKTYEGFDIQGLIQHVKKEGQDWETFERFELVEVE